MGSEVDAVVAAFYAAFDNRAGAPAAAPLLALFAPEATITAVGDETSTTWGPDAFAAPRIAMLTDGTLVDFHEWETDASTVVHANIASRWSRYAKEGRLNGADYRGTGRKLIHLRRVDGRWLISSVLWEDD